MRPTLCLLLTLSGAPAFAQRAGAAPVDGRPVEATARPEGRFHLIPPPGAAGPTVYPELRSIFIEVTDDLNRRFVIPYDVDVVLQSCPADAMLTGGDYDDGRPDLWDRKKALHAVAPGKRRRVISFCDQDYLEARGLAPRDALGYMRFSLYHEAAHALIDVLALPITGREEAAADQFATVTLLNAGADQAVHQASVVWFARSKQEPIDSADEHLGDKQRYYDIVCLVYGKDPAAGEKLVAKGYLSKDRAPRCPDEYIQAQSSWTALLAPHRRKS